MKDVELRPTDEQFYDDLAQFFAKFIFEKTGVDLDDELTPVEL
jgi:hypothetical protein